MRIPYPTRIAPLHSAIFASLLCLVQLVEGTPGYFSVATFLIIFISTLAFNAAGGLSRPSGAYVFFYSVLTVIVGFVIKAFLGEAADTNLFAPQTTILVYLGGISAMYVAVLAAHRLTPKKALLDGIGSAENWGSASLGCILIGVAISLWGIFFPGDGDSGSVLGVVRQLDRFLPLGIILGAIYTIRRSGGRRLWSLPVAAAVSFMVIYNGLIGGSKQGLFTPLLCVVLAAAVSRYNFSFRQMAVSALGIFIAVVYVVPFVQISKQFETDYAGKVNLAVEYFTNTGGGAEEKAAHKLIPYEEENDFMPHYYNEPQGFADRLEMLAIDDPLIDVTNQGHVFGIYPTAFAFLNIIPHFIWPGKPIYEFGNQYWHEIGYNHYVHGNQDDFTTGISISPAADAYHEARWYGVFLLAPALWFSAFFMLDWLCGDVRKSPWGLVAIVLTAHIAPEGALPGVVGLMTLGFLGISMVSLLAAYVLPVVASLVFGPGKTRVRRVTVRRPVRAELGGSAPSISNRTL